LPFAGRDRVFERLGVASAILHPRDELLLLVRRHAFEALHHLRRIEVPTAAAAESAATAALSGAVVSAASPSWPNRLPFDSPALP
jgi:hypothetical protein